MAASPCGICCGGGWPLAAANEDWEFRALSEDDFTARRTRRSCEERLTDVNGRGDVDPPRRMRKRRESFNGAHRRSHNPIVHTLHARSEPSANRAAIANGVPASLICCRYRGPIRRVVDKFHSGEGSTGAVTHAVLFHSRRTCAGFRHCGSNWKQRAFWCLSVTLCEPRPCARSPRIQRSPQGTAA